jgi:hypothetical protein
MTRRSSPIASRWSDSASRLDSLSRVSRRSSRARGAQSAFSARDDHVVDLNLEADEAAGVLRG